MIWVFRTVYEYMGQPFRSAILKLIQSLPGAYVVELEPIEDERGFFARTWCCQEFEALG